jgi:6-phosphogluconolactonase/glucosamine-6-phosphate isomerase/deaminase
MAVKKTQAKEKGFSFKPAEWIPFQDQSVINKLRPMTAEEIEKHPNPNFHIKVVHNIGAIEIADMYAGIVASDKENKKFTFICGNPNPSTYLPLAAAINLNRINCRNVFPFTMDEWADDQGNIAPVTYRSGFTYSFLKYFYNQIDPELRMPLKNIGYPTTKNIDHYSDMIDEAGGGGADVIYSGPGWAGHVAFIDPCPEFIPGYKGGGKYILKSLKDPYFEQTARVVSLHPLTIAQNSLHGVFGCSGDIASVPPKAATIGPRDVLHARKKLEFHGLSTFGTFSSWQRMISRLITHGPVTPYIPGSMYQLMDAYLYIEPNIAQPIECLETTGY